MTKFPLNRLLGIAFLSLVGLFPGASAADHLGQSVVTDGVLVYLGVVPSDALKNDPEHYGKHNMQCAPPGGPDNYHVMVALFDSKTGKRITDAEVHARVSPIGLVGPRKHLHAITVADAMTYCNYFDLPPTDTYDIQVEILRPESPDVIHATFTYTPYRD